jgi:NAD-dependent SIR2 family protein deacetylase
MKNKPALATRNCSCAFCKNNLPFTLPQEVIDATMSGDLVVFAGAGISTESSMVFRRTFYEEIKLDLRIPKKENISFAALMTKYSEQPNGNKKLAQRIEQRFEYCAQFRQLYLLSTRFHKELASIYSIKNIVTTNWDDFFERECGAVPLVTAEDFAFFNLNRRKVFKLHGSINSPGSIVATEEQYKKCYKRLQKGVIGAHLKSMLASKVILFVGFSFRDADINRIYNYIKKEMKGFLPHAYIVTIDPDIAKQFDQMKVTVIQTNGYYFIETLRKHLEGINFLIEKENLDAVWDANIRRRDVHAICSDHYQKHKSVSAIYNLFYQDGIRHALDYLDCHATSGNSFDPLSIIGTVETYEKMGKKLLREKKYMDYPYVQGYIAGLQVMITAAKPADIAYYFIMGKGKIYSQREFFSEMKKGNIYHRGAELRGQKLFKDLMNSDGVVPDHVPEL